MTTQHPPDQEADAPHDASDLDVQAFALDLLRHLFLAGPTDECLRAFADIDQSAVDDEDAFLRGLGRMAQTISTGLAAEASYGERLRAEFTRLFEGPGEMPAVPFASYYLSRIKALMTDETLAVRAQYLEAGLAVEALNRVPDDFVGIEIEFLYFLTREALAAREAADPAASNVRIEQRRRFVDEHLALWLPEFAASIEQATAEQAFSALANALQVLPNALLQSNADTREAPGRSAAPA